MGDAEDETFESTDAGASETYPMEAGQIRKSGHIMIKGNPCKVIDVSTSKTGKHGHAKCNFLAVDIFTGKKLEDMVPSTHGTTVPVVSRVEWEVLDITDEDFLSLTNDGGDIKEDLKLPDVPDTMAQEIRDAWDEGNNQVIVTVQSAVDIEQVVAFKKGAE